jgi:hypothetical protein
MNTPAVGDRFIFSTRGFAAEYSGRPCTLIEIYDATIEWPYAVRFDDGKETVAVDRNLSPILADGSVGEPLQPAAGSRKGWDGFQKMLEHSKNVWFIHYGTGIVSKSRTLPTREELIAANMMIPVQVCWDDGRREPMYYPTREQAEVSIGNYGLSASRAKESAA